MNWTKILLAGIVGGILMNIANFIMHPVILGNIYTKYPDVFSQTQANPLWFLLIAILMAFFSALLFAKTRSCWADGWKGGATFGFYLGLVSFFAQFISSLVIDGFPYHLSWCWGGTALIGMTVMGLGLGLVHKN
jgi:hypothetical protein